MHGAMKHRIATLITPVIAGFGLVAIPTATAHAAGTAYYVDCAATADGSGTQNSPFNSLADVDARTFGPGDQILFDRGTTCVGEFDPQGSGSASAQITADAYGTGAQPVIAGNGTVVNTVYLYNQDYWTLQNLEITNSSTTASQRIGIDIALQDYGVGEDYQLKDLTVANISGDETKSSIGIQFSVYGNTTPTKFDHVTVDGNTIENVDRVGISSGSTWTCQTNQQYYCASGTGSYYPATNITWENNTLDNLGGDGIIMRTTQGGVIQGNVAHDLNERSASDAAGIWTIDSAGTVIQDNEVYNVQRPTGTFDGEAFDSDLATWNTVVQDNYSHDNQGGFMLFCEECSSNGVLGGGAVVRYNVSQNDASRILEGAGSESDRVYNNTVYLPSGSTTSFIHDDRQTYLAVDDNILYDGGTGVSSYTASQTSFAGNLVYGNNTGNELDDTDEISANPGLNSPGSGGDGIATLGGYTLQSTSPALANGIAVPGNGGSDLYGDAVPQTCQPDRGADQHSSFNDAACTPAVTNGGFETGSLAPWTGNGTVTTSPVDSGSHALALGAADATAEQLISVQPNTTYALTGWLQVTADANQVELGVKNYGGPQLTAPLATTSWTQGSYSYTNAGYWQQEALAFTTGPTQTQATIFCYHDQGSAPAYCDDVSAVAVGTELVSNGGLETGSLSPWTGTGSVVTTPVESGSYALGVNGTGTTAQQIITVQPNTTYQLTGSGIVGATGNTVELGVKNYGGTQLGTLITSTSWTQGALSFTTGSSATQATIFCFHDAGSGNAACDNISVTKTP